jgi:hypothetical protein
MLAELIMPRLEASARAGAADVTSAFIWLMVALVFALAPLYVPA